MIQDGTMDEAIIANTAKLTLERVKLLQEYQESNEWRRYGWGKCLVELNGKVYLLGVLRNEKDDFEMYPFVGYEVEGKTKLKLKRRVDINDEYTSDTIITWEDVKNMKRVGRGVWFKMPYQTVNEAIAIATVGLIDK